MSALLGVGLRHSVCQFASKCPATVKKPTFCPQSQTQSQNVGQSLLLCGWRNNINRLFTTLGNYENILSHAPKNVVNSLRPARKSLHTIPNSLQRTVKPQSSKLILLSLGSWSFGSVAFWKTYSSDVFCEYKPKNRISTYEGAGKEREPQLPWRELFKMMLPDLWYLLGAVLSALAVAVINIQIPLVLGEIVNVLTHYTAETHGDFTQEVKTPALRLVYLYGLQGLLTFSYISLLGAVGERVASRLRQQLFHSIITQDIAFFDNHKTGEIVNRLTTDVQDFKSSFKMCISQGLRSITQTLGCIVSLFIVSPKMTTVMVIVIPTIIGFGSLMGSGLRKLSRTAQAQVSKATAVADEAIGNVRTVRAFSMEPKEIELYNKEVEEASRLNQWMGVGIGLFQGLSNTALNGIVLGTLYVGGFLMSTHEMKAGDLMSFMVAVQTIQRSLAQMSLLFGQAVRGISAGARVFEYIQLTPLMPTTGGKQIPYHSMKGTIKFSHVTFSYPTRANHVVLKDFSLQIPGGRMVALVGLSGGGKSTVAGLLERFYDVDEGSITVDGVNIKELDSSWLRGRAIGYINQEPVLFATSILENIRYGRPDATDNEVFEAAQMANAHDFINSFPAGYNTVLGERGVTVSGGQKQRIAIARALIKRPSILILDEATSALDAESERVVQEALDKVVKGRTVLVIAHRLSTIRNADTIAVVSNGVIAETLGCIVSLFIVSPKMTTVMVIVIPTIIGFGSLMGSGLRKLSRTAQAQVSKATAVADEAIGNVRTVRAFSMEPKEIELYNKEVEEASRLNQWMGVGIGLFQGLSNTALNGIVLGTLYVGGFLMSTHEMKAGDLMSFMVAVQTIQRSLAQMSLLFGQAVRGISAGARVFEYIQLTPLMPTTGGKQIPYHSMKGTIKFSHVTFSYPTRANHVVLKDFSLQIPGGRMVALVGLSGGGKSTVAGLLERFYDVDEGSITVDGVNIKELDSSWLRGRAIGYINQEPVLFATSILENIRYGRPDATDNEVFEAAQMANAHDFINSFPAGYNTVLGERGVTVSGGQKQRIAIARALIKRPSILILDEATSALDAESERVVQEALDKVVKGRTVLVIAHRLSTIRNADTIAVVSNGVIAEMGNHDELSKKRGLYWNLIRHQETEQHDQEGESTGWFNRKQA